MGKLIDQAKRAQAKEAKEDRKRLIRDAAQESFVNQPYVDVSLDAICLRARLRKGIAAMYFGSKEELFLDLLQRQLVVWSDDLCARLGEIRSGAGKSLVEVVASSLAERPVLTRLLGLLPVVLEQHDQGAVLQVAGEGGAEQLVQRGAFGAVGSPRWSAGGRLSAVRGK